MSVARSENYLRRPEVKSGLWSHYYGGPEHQSQNVETFVDRARLEQLLERLTQLPTSFTPHRKISRWLENRGKMAHGQAALDWSAAEALAMASLATEGHRVRMTGQDSHRGTFSHRHAVLHDYENGNTYMPLAHLAPDQAPVEIINSPLSEVAVLGFEYGYSLYCPDGLTIWEAQFGDFCNVAQMIIDQFIASAEDKWGRLSGLVLLLPHGFEGMGPEHSSARLERFLGLAAEDNMQIVNPTTPAQYFHCLRRQVVRRWRKPLVTMTPKSLLRHPKVHSPFDDFATGQFHRILPDADGTEREVTRVLLCSGKIYYELEQRREASGRPDVAILRLEQLYPLDDEVLRRHLEPYPEETPVYWVQEEPENMGAWPFLLVRYGRRLLGRYPFAGISRAMSASPATGSASSHKLEQEQILGEAFGESISNPIKI